MMKICINYVEVEMIESSFKMLKNVALIGSGHIARDLYRKIKNDKYLDLYLVAGRNNESDGMLEAKIFSKYFSDQGIKEIQKKSKFINVVIDCTSAESHIKHSEILSKLNLPVIDLTPSGIGLKIVPTVNISNCKNNTNVNLVSCGGQSSIPILHTWSSFLSKQQLKLKYVEIASTISTKSAGMATRRNIDSYIKNTENAIKEFCNCDAKVILNINPAEPPITMKTSFSALIENTKAFNNDWIEITSETEKAIQKYVPGYKITVPPRLIDGKRLFSSAEIKGRGDYLPSYSGNLDIITSAAIEVAKII